MIRANKKLARGQLGYRGTSVNATDCGFDPLEEMKFLLTFIFSFLRPGVEAKRSLEFRHSTRNASRTRRKVGNGVS